MDTQSDPTAANNGLLPNPAPKLFTANQWQELVRNGQIATTDPDASSLSLRPVVKLFTPDAAATWLFTEVTPNGLLFGLCDLGM